MDNKYDSESQSQNSDKLKEIPKWTRKYAQNRSLTLLVLVIMILLVSIFISFPLGLGMAAFKKGNMVLGLVCVAAEIVVWIFLIIFILKFGGKNRGRLDQLIDQWIYGREGCVSLPKSESSNKRIGPQIAISVIWFFLFFGTMHLGNAHIVHVKYLQPIAALFTVPYMVAGWYFWNSPKMGPIYLLLPALYTIHAFLILAGVPLYFTGSVGPALNLSLPFIGYGLLTYVVSHIYSRYALQRLKGMAQIHGDSPSGI